jgi:hypothetical protein
MINYYSALDRGNEGINEGINLRSPLVLTWTMETVTMTLMC